MNLQNYSLWTALITPFHSDGSLDKESLKSLLQEQNDANNAVLLLGSTGEALNLALEQRKELLEYAVSIKQDVPYMVGVGGNDIEEQKKWIEYCNSLNIDCFLMVTPHYAKPGDKGQYQWFKSLMDVSQKPVMLYNVPGRTAKELSFEAVEKLMEHPRFWAIKEASGDIEKFKQYQHIVRKNVFCGDDALFADFAKNASAGLVSVASNVWPQIAHDIVTSFKENIFDGLKEWQEASNFLFIASNPIPAKRLLKYEDRINNDLLKLPLTTDDCPDISSILKASENLKQWYKNKR